jgi:hypothetical protein
MDLRRRRLNVRPLTRPASGGAHRLAGSTSGHIEASRGEAAGDHTAARQALAVARDRLLVQAARIGDPDMRRSFLEAVPENARIQALAAQWLGKGPYEVSSGEQ